jgi:hypothetical protein
VRPIRINTPNGLGENASAAKAAMAEVQRD